MPGNYNRVILVGNVTKDPELKKLPSGASVCKFGLAVNRKTKNSDETMFVDIAAWDKLAEICMKYLKKGRSVLVEGRLAIRSYEDQTGVSRKATEVVIDSMQLLDKREENGGGYPVSLYGEPEEVAF